MLRKNELIELTVTAISHDGSGVGRHTDGMVVFVPLTAIGDRALVKIVKVQKHLAYGILVELPEPSLHRAPQDCPVFAHCGGCSLRHIPYWQELEIKTGWLRDNLRNIAGIDIPLDSTIASPSAEHYRNKAMYPIRLLDGNIHAGFFAKRSHRLLPVTDCPLQPAFFADVCRTVTGFLEQFHIPPYDEEGHTGLVRHLFIRHASATGQVMVCLVLRKKRLPHSDVLIDRLKGVCPGLASFCININPDRTNVVLGPRTEVLYGAPYIEDILCGMRLRLSPHSFYQVNRDAAELLYGAALEYARPCPEDTILDLYCGAGSIGLSMARAAGRIIGVEMVPQAVEDARKHAAANAVSHARFLCADAGEAAEALRREGGWPDIAILDPPRKGVDASVIHCIHALGPEKVVYISCNSATLARDAKLLASCGYRMARARAVDLFPRTAHVEALSLLIRDPCNGTI